MVRIHAGLFTKEEIMSGLTTEELKQIAEDIITLREQINEDLTRQLNEGSTDISLEDTAEKILWG